MFKSILKILPVLLMLLVGCAAFAAGGDAEAGGSAAEYGMKGFIALAAGLGIGIAAFGGALGQGKTAAAALEGIARNPGAQNKIFIPMLLALAFVESLVIFTWIIEFFLYGKLG